MIAGTVVEDILVAILNSVSVAEILQWVMARTSEAEVQAILNAQYKAVSAAADAEAEATLKP